MQVQLPVAVRSLTANEVFSFLFLESDIGRAVLVLIRAFIDDSADGTRQKYIIASSIMGNLKHWREIERQWKITLRQPPAIKWFHSMEWRSLLGEFRQFTDPVKWPKPTGGRAADAKREALLKILEKPRVIAIAVAVLVPDYEKLRASDPRAARYFGADAYECALQAVIFESAKATRELKGDHCIGFVCDHTDKAERYVKVYREFKARNPKTAESMHGIAYLDDKKWPGLQAADLCAHIAKTAFDKWDGKTRMRELPPFAKVAYWDEDYMRDVLAANVEADFSAAGS